MSADGIWHRFHEVFGQDDVVEADGIGEEGSYLFGREARFPLSELAERG